MAGANVRRLVGVIAAAGAAVVAGSLPVPLRLQQPSDALPLAIGLGALGATVLPRWDLKCGWRREHRPVLGAFVALFALLSFTVLVRVMFVTTWSILLMLAAGAFCGRLLSILDTIGTELCRTELPEPAIPDPAAAPRHAGLAWPTAVALLVLVAMVRAVGFFVHTVRREWLS